MRLLSSIISACGGVACILGGAFLLWLRSTESVLTGDYFAGGVAEQLGHGVGVYCIGRGLAILGGSLRHGSSQRP